MRKLKEFKKTKIKMGLVTNIFNPSTGEPVNRSLWELKASLIYIESSYQQGLQKQNNNKYSITVFNDTYLLSIALKNAHYWLDLWQTRLIHLV